MYELFKVYLSHLYDFVRGVCNFLGSVSSQQKFEAKDGPALQSSEGPVIQLCVIQFYLESKGKYILEAWGNADPKEVNWREAPSPILAPLFIYFFLLPLGLPCVNWAGQEHCLFYWGPHSSSDRPLFYFCRLFLSLSFSNHHSGLLFSLLPNNLISVFRCAFELYSRTVSLSIFYGTLRLILWNKLWHILL